MLPSFYQACLQAQLTSIQFITLKMLVALLQRERQVSLERLATLFAQPIQFESRRRNIQRFLQLPQLNVKALWFPIVKHWLKQQFHRGQKLYLVIDRTAWKHHNLLLVSLVHHKRAIPLFWHRLDHRGASSLADQQAALRPVFVLLSRYACIVLGDREFHSIALADWLRQQRVQFVLRLPKSTTVKSHVDNKFERLDKLPQYPGIACFEVQVQVTQQQGFGHFNLVTRWKRVYRQSKANQVWYLLTNLNDLETAMSSYAKRWSIEPMFRDFKSGGYNLENCRALGQRFLALVLLVAIAYTLTTEQGKRMGRKQIQHYVGRVPEPKRDGKRHSHFWIGLYGQLWISSMDLWSSWAEELMHLKPQKRRFFRLGLRAMSLIQSAL